MSPDDISFICILVASVLLGAASAWIPAQLRPLVFAFAGAAGLVLSCGLSSIHPALTTIAVVVVLRMSPQRQHGRLCATVSFGYLGALRLLDPPAGVANAAQLMLTLRLTSLGFDSADGRLPTTIDIRSILLYASSAHGLFTGPFYTYEKWISAMCHRAPLAPRALAGVLLQVIMTISVWQGIGRILPFSSIRALATQASPLWSRLLLFFVSSFQFRFA